MEKEKQCNHSATPQGSVGEHQDGETEQRVSEVIHGRTAPGGFESFGVVEEVC